MRSDRTTQLQNWIDQLRQGDGAAREALIDGALVRLKALTHDLITGDRLRRWEETDDVLQEALITLHRSLADVWPETVQEFLRLAALHIRRALIKFARHYYGPQGKGTNHASGLNGRHNGGADWSHVSAKVDPPDQQLMHVEQLACMIDAVERLPEDERDVTELLWLHGLSQVEVAALLEVSDRTVRRRWQQARLKLNHALEPNQNHNGPSSTPSPQIADGDLARAGNGHDFRNLSAEREQPA